MAQSLSDEFREAALEVVDLFGAEYQIVRRTPTTPDPSKPTRVVMTEERWHVKAALVGFTEEQIKFLNVLREDMQAIIAWNADLPKDIRPGDLLFDGTREYTLVPPETTMVVSGEVVAWQVLARR